MSDLTVTVDEYGPYIVLGDVLISDENGLELPYDVELCRCGHSENQPFCDGAHTTIDFDGTLAN